MKIKIVGFKVGVSRPTANRTIDSSLEKAFRMTVKDFERYVGRQLLRVLLKSDFISIRRIKD